MKNTGVTRRIDELGRIVIPKEIRRVLSIRDGENLEILIEDDMIILKKYLLMQNLVDLSEKLINVYSSVDEATILVTDREKVIATTSNIKEYINQKISNELLKTIDTREIINSKEIKNISFEKDALEGYFTIVPIINDIDCLGLIIFYNTKEFINENLKLAKIFSKILSEKININ